MIIISKKGGELMVNKKRFFVVLIVVIGLLLGLLGACGKSDETDAQNKVKEKTNKNGLNPGEIVTITYEELIEKLDNKESFFLLPLEVKEDIFIESGVKEYFSNSLKEHGFGAYYIYITREEDDEELRNYTHEKFALDEGMKEWVPVIEGFVYVDNGGVISAYKSQQYGVGDDSLKAEAELGRNEIKSLLDEYDPRVEEKIKKIVDYRISKFFEWGFELQ